MADYLHTTYFSYSQKTVVYPQEGFVQFVHHDGDLSVTFASRLGPAAVTLALSGVLAENNINVSKKVPTNSLQGYNRKALKLNAL